MSIISLDTEATGLDLRHGCKPFYVTICSGTDIVHWLWEVDPKTRQPRVIPGDLDEIRDRINEADRVVGQNFKFDIGALEQVGIKWVWWDKIDDTLLSGHLLGSGDKHDLTTQALRYLRVNIQPYEDDLEKACKEARQLVKRELPDWKIIQEGMYPSAKTTKAKKTQEKDKLWKWDMWLPERVAEFKGYPQTHAWRTVLPLYSDSDSGVTLPLHKEHLRLLEQRRLMGVYEARRKLIRRIYEMEKRGLTYSEKRLDEIANRFENEVKQSLRTCLTLSNGKLDSLPDAGTTKAMTSFVFDDLKLPVVNRSEKTKAPGINKKAMESWLNTLPPMSKGRLWVNNLRIYRSRKTALTFVASYRRHRIPGISINKYWKDYCLLHSSYNPTGSDTLRFSCANPNAENISKQDETNLRYAFGPPPGREWWSCDYSNVELRIPAYESGEKDMIALFERPNDPPYFGSQHLLIAHLLWPDEFNECLRLGDEFKKKYKATLYQWTKNGDFAVQYNAQEISGTADEAYHQVGAQRKIKERFRKIEALSQSQISYAKKYGYVWTMTDKEIGSGYPLVCSRNDWGSVKETVPLAYHVSGTAMWCMCKAMCRVGDYLDTLPDHHMVAQIHDELLFDFPKTKIPGDNLPKVKEIVRLMEMSGEDIGIPLPVSYSYHPVNWKDEHQLAV